MTDPREMLRRAKPLELPVEVCLDGQLVAEHHELQRAYQRASDQPRERISSGGETRRLSEQLRALEERIRSATVSVRVRSLGKDGWNALVERHPKRVGNEVDENLGYNGDTFFDELVPLSMVSMVPLSDSDAEPVDLIDEDRQMLVEVMTRQKFDEVAAVALTLNIRPVKIPFSSAGSTPTPHSEPE